MSFPNQNKTVKVEGKVNSVDKKVVSVEERESISEVSKDKRSPGQGEIRFESNFSSIVAPGRNSDANKNGMPDLNERVSEPLAKAEPPQNENQYEEGLTTDRDMYESFDWDQEEEEDIKQDEMPPMLKTLKEYQAKKNQA